MDTATWACLRRLACALALAACTTPAWAATYTVKTNGSARASADALAGPYCDSNPAGGDQEACTLAAAIDIANLAATRDRIEFDLPTITLTASLPAIVHPVDIVGEASGGDPATAIDGADQGLFVFANGASLNGGSSISNLKLMNGSGEGLRLDGSPYIVENLWIGLDAGGTAAAPNGGSGIEVQNSVSKVPPALNDLNDLLAALGLDSFGELYSSFGTNPAAFVTVAKAFLGQDNAVAITNSVISGNEGPGVRIAGGQDNMGNDVLTAGVILAGNHIGTNATGTAAVPNGTGTSGDGSGVLVEINAALNFVIGNVIAANEGQGVNLVPGEVDFPNVVGGNFIGLPNPFDVPDPLGLGPGTWGNFESGVFVGSRPSAGNAAQVSAVVAANFIGFNRCGTWTDADGLPPFSPDPEDGGIAVTSGSDRTIVVGNLVGVAEFPPGGDILDLGNLCTGINVSNGRNTIGGANILDANAIGANDGDGILLFSANTNGNVVKGNRIGRDYTDSATFSNEGYGIRILNSGGNIIGFEDGDAPLFGPNVIAAPGASGIRMEGANAFGNLLRRNRIYGWPAGFIGIELDADNSIGQDLPDPIDDDEANPLAYANWGQNRPQVCTSGIPAGPCTGASDPAFSGGNTTVQWTLSTFTNATFRIDFYAVSDEDAQWLQEVVVTTDGTGTPVSNGPCDANALCTSSFASSDTRGSRILLTATRIDENIADIPPLEPDPPGDPNDDGPINNTSEFSDGVVIPDQIVFGQASYVVAESEGSVVLTVSRLGSGAASITLTLTDLTTQPADHGVLGTTTLTWAANDGQDKTVEVPIVQDAIDEPNQGFEVSFVIDSSDNAAAGVPDTAQVTITDDDAAPLLSIAALGAVEGEDLAFTVTRQGATEFTVSAGYAATPAVGTEAADIDGSSGALAGTVLIPPGETTALVLVHAVDDAIFEPAEDVTVALDNPVNATLDAGATAATAAIAASDSAPVFSIDHPAQAETDANAPIVFTVSRSGLTELPASVDYAVQAGSATTPADYLAGADPLAGTLSFAAADTQQTVSLLLVGDDLHEPAASETFSVQLSNPTGGSLGSATGTATITDDDPAQTGELRFTAASFDVSEGDAPVDAVVSVERIGGSDGAASVDCVAAAGTATAGVDFTAAAVPASWNDGESGTRQCLVPIAGDLLSENAETILLSLANATGASVGTPFEATLTIADNDPLPVLSISGPAPTAEGDSPTLTPLTFLVQLGTASGRTVTVQASSQDGSATAADSDYQPVDQPVTFAPGETQQMVVVNAVGDATDEADETLSVALSAPDGATLANTPELAVATLLNDDAPPPSAGQVRFTAPSATVGESAGPAVVAVERVDGSAGAVSVDCIAGPGTATAADFTAATQTLSWADGVDGIQGCVVAITPDALDEDDEVVALTLANAQGGVALDSPSAASLTITDDDVEPVLSIADLSLPEGDGPGATSFGFLVTLSAPSGRTVSVTAATADGSATAPDDYAPLAAPVSFVPGVTSQVVTVAVVGDTVDEAADETFTVTLSVPANATLAADPSATGTIGNDDVPPPAAGTLQFGAPTYSIGEAGLQATITVTRSDGSDGAVTVDYASSDGSATAGSDYAAAAGTLAWADGDAAAKSFDVPVSDDATDEADETVTLTLANPTNGAALGAPATAVLTLLDDDAATAAGTLQFSAPTFSIGEAGVQATITVSRSGGSDGAVAVDYATGDGSATAGSDYTAASGTLSWADGDDAPQSFAVPVSNDAIDEADETVALTLANPTNGAMLAAPETALLTIVDDDAAAPGSKSFSGPTQTGSGTQSVVFTGGGEACGFSAGTALVAAPTPLPAGGYLFPHGVFASSIANCTVGATLSVTVTYPQPLPAGTVFWKHGPTQADPSPHWQVFPATISGNTATFSLVDGGPGDGDLTANGSIVDASGPAFQPGTAPPLPAPQMIPTLGEVSRWVLLLLLAGIAAWQLRAARPVSRSRP